jgi:hypothetical protein
MAIIERVAGERIAQMERAAVECAARVRAAHPGYGQYDLWGAVEEAISADYAGWLMGLPADTARAIVRRVVGEV